MKKFFVAVAVACFAVLGLAAPAQAGVDSELNHTAYWEAYTAADDTCSKVELDGEGKTFTLAALPSGQKYTLLVVKAGTGTTVLVNPTAGVAYATSTGKGLSWAIYCVSDGPYNPYP
jgi:hypothetical protein